MNIRVAKTVNNSEVDGPGLRTVVFLAGCPIHCPGCQNQDLWDPAAGEDLDTMLLAAMLTSPGLPITISGGEPFAQPEALYWLIRWIRLNSPKRHIVVYTGYTLNQLYDMVDFNVAGILAKIDVLVDGPYDRTQDSETMQYRGSANQRVIDIPATFTRSGTWTEFFDTPALLDWDEPELILTEDGDLVAASPLAREFSEIGAVWSTRRCGEVP